MPCLTDDTAKILENGCSDGWNDLLEKCCNVTTWRWGFSFLIIFLAIALLGSVCWLIRRNKTDREERTGMERTLSEYNQPIVIDAETQARYSS